MNKETEVQIKIWNKFARFLKENQDIKESLNKTILEVMEETNVEFYKVEFVVFDIVQQGLEYMKEKYQEIFKK